MKANLYLNLYESVCYDYFHLKAPLKLLVKPFLHTFLFTDHLNHKTVHKTTCRAPSANPRQLWAHKLKSF